MKKLQLLALFMLCSASFTLTKECDDNKREAKVKKEKSAKKQKVKKKINHKNEEVFSVRRDIRIIKEHIKIEKMTHHQLSSFVSRIIAFQHDLKKDSFPMTEAEAKVMKEAIAKAKKAYKELSKHDKDEHLMKKIKNLEIN